MKKNFYELEEYLRTDGSLRVNTLIIRPDLTELYYISGGVDPSFCGENTVATHIFSLPDYYDRREEYQTIALLAAPENYHVYRSRCYFDEEENTLTQSYSFDDTISDEKFNVISERLKKNFEEMKKQKPELEYTLRFNRDTKTMNKEEAINHVKFVKETSKSRSLKPIDINYDIDEKGVVFEITEDGISYEI